MQRADNFNAGPSALPLPVLERVQAELLNFRDTGMSVMELSHRSKPYEAIHYEAMDRLRRLMGLSDAYDILFVQGGASTQFAMLPMNFLQQGLQAGYALTGSWSEKAAKEAKRYGNIRVDHDVLDGGYTAIPTEFDPTIVDNSTYVHITTNNTIYGTQWRKVPERGAIRRLVADMSSDILSQPFPFDQFDMVYAGAQKNLGPSGVTVIAVRKDWLAEANEDVPTMLSYKTHAKAGSLYNTPPTFAVYVMNLVLEWIETQGGLEALGEQNRKKAGLIYDVIDEYEMYHGHAETDARSLMNVTFRLPDDELSKQFLDEAVERGFVGVKGHRSVGGCRVSLYNAVPIETAARFAEFMHDFARRRR